MDNLAYIDEYREELLDGKIICMAPPFVNHNIVTGNIFILFKKYFKGKPCEAFTNWGYVHFSKKDNVIPDVMVICKKDIIKRDGIYGTPDLIIEVLSPSTAKNDRGYKKNLYEKHGIGEYWIVEPDACTVEVYYLKEKTYILDDVYSFIPGYNEEKMINFNDEEKKKNIRSLLFHDMEILLDDVFSNRYYYEVRFVRDIV